MNAWELHLRLLFVVLNSVPNYLPLHAKLCTHIDKPCLLTARYWTIHLFLRMNTEVLPTRPELWESTASLSYFVTYRTDVVRHVMHDCKV